MKGPREFELVGDLTSLPTSETGARHLVWWGNTGFMVIEGTGGLRGGMIDSHGDHRIAMLGAVAGLASREGVEVANMEAAAVSYPGFEADLAALL